MMVSLLPSHRETIEAIQTAPWSINIIQNSRPHNQHDHQNNRVSIKRYSWKNSKYSNVYTTSFRRTVKINILGLTLGKL